MKFPKHPIRPRNRSGPGLRPAVIPLFGVAVLCSCLGCGGEDWHADTHPARGRVTINGEPAEGAVVELHPQGERPDVRNSRPWAVVQQDGSYTLSTYETGDGAPAGAYAATVRWPPDVSQPSLADRLDGAYATPQRSRWTFDVVEGDNALPPIEIQGVAVQSQERADASRQAPPGPAMGTPRP